MVTFDNCAFRNDAICGVMISDKKALTLELNVSGYNYFIQFSNEEKMISTYHSLIELMKEYQPSPCNPRRGDCHVDWGEGIKNLD